MNLYITLPSVQEYAVKILTRQKDGSKSFLKQSLGMEGGAVGLSSTGADRRRHSFFKVLSALNWLQKWLYDESDCSNTAIV